MAVSPFTGGPGADTRHGVNGGRDGAEGAEKFRENHGKIEKIIVSRIYSTFLNYYQISSLGNESLICSICEIGN